MNDYQPLLLIAALAVGAYQLIRIQQRLRNTEAMLNVILRHLNIEWGQFAEPSARVKELARDPGSKIQAIQAYREQTGLGLKEALEVIEGLAKRDAS